MSALLRHLLATYKISALSEIFKIGQSTWRQHKVFIEHKGEKGQQLNEKHYKHIRDTYKAHLLEKYTEVRDIDCNIY